MLITSAMAAVETDPDKAETQRTGSFDAATNPAATDLQTSLDLGEHEVEHLNEETDSDDEEVVDESTIKISTAVVESMITVLRQTFLQKSALQTVWHYITPCVLCKQKLFCRHSKVIFSCLNLETTDSSI